MMTYEERSALESELAQCRADLQKYQGAVDFWNGTEADDGSNVLITAENMITLCKKRITEIELLLTRPNY